MTSYTKYSITRYSIEERKYLYGGVNWIERSKIFLRENETPEQVLDLWKKDQPERTYRLKIETVSYIE